MRKIQISMKKPSFSKSLLALLFFFSPFCNLFSQAPTFAGVTSVPADNNPQVGPTVTVGPPAGMAANYLAIIYAQYRGNVVPTISASAGQTWNTATTYNGGGALNQYTAIFWCNFNGTWSGSPAVTVGAGNTNALTAIMYAFKPGVSTDIWGVNVAATNNTSNTSPNSIAAITTTAPTTVSMAFWSSSTSITWGTLSGAGWSKTGLTAQYRNTTTGQTQTAAYDILTAVGSTAAVAQTPSVAPTALRTILSWYEAPVNDVCANASTITQTTTCTAGVSSLTGQTLNNAADDGGTIASGCTAFNPPSDVWYKFVAQTTFPLITLSNFGASWTTHLKVQLLSGSCGGFTEVGCGNNTGPTATFSILPTSALTVGNTYYIRVFKNNVGAATGSVANWAFDICVTGPSVTGSGRMVEVFQSSVLSPPNVLQYPWEVTYGPDGFLWVTESHGYKAYRIDPNTGAKTIILDISQGSATADITGAEHTTFNVKFPPTQNPWPQGGFAGLAIHPQFNSGKPYVYISYVDRFDSNSVAANAGVFFTNYLVRFTYSGGKLTAPVVVCDTLPGSSDHNSQRLIIAPVGGTYYLFYGQGDMGAGQFGNQFRVNNAQNLNSYQGKILRFNLEPDGDAGAYDQWIPNSNPFNGAKQSAIYALGIRNNQGFAFDTSTNILYGSSHGPFSDDEINIIEASRNYGHPLVEGFAQDNNYNGITAGTAPNMAAGGSSCPTIVNEQANATALGANYRDPLFSAYTTPTPVSPSNYTTMNQLWNGTNGANNIWPSEGWSGLDIYSHKLIPGWKRSLVASGLKWGRLIRLKLSPTGTTTLPSNLTYGNTGDTVTYFQSTNRYRDLAFDPNGRDIYILMDNSAATSGPGIGNPIVAACPGCLMKYTFLGYADQAGESTIPQSIDVTDATVNVVDSGTQITIDNSNNFLWVPITGPDGNILAEIYPNGNNLGVVKSAFYKNSGPIRVSKGVHYLDRNITITPQNQPGTPVKIRLYFSAAEYNALHADGLSGVNAITDVKILKNEDVCSATIQSGTTVVTPTFSEAHGANGYMLQGNITNFSSFYFASANIPLPLNLLSFKGSFKDNATLLEWETTNEVNTSQFIVERSADGQNFKDIGTVAAKNVSGDNNYTFTDNDAIHQPVSILYYRLKMTDRDGSFTYSNVVTIVLPVITGKLTVSPNPASDHVMVSIATTSDAKIRWSITDNTGRVMIQNTTQLKKGNNIFSVNTSRLSNGIYYLSLIGGGLDQKVKLEKL